MPFISQNSRIQATIRLVLILFTILILSLYNAANLQSSTLRGKSVNTNKEKQAAKANRLLHEKSPYLLQHAYNPVDWYPWTEEAFALAKS